MSTPLKVSDGLNWFWSLSKELANRNVFRPLRKGLVSAVTAFRATYPSGPFTGTNKEDKGFPHSRARYTAEDNIVFNDVTGDDAKLPLLAVTITWVADTQDNKFFLGDTWENGETKYLAPDNYGHFTTSNLAGGSTSQSAFPTTTTITNTFTTPSGGTSQTTTFVSTYLGKYTNKFKDASAWKWSLNRFGNRILLSGRTAGRITQKWTHSTTDTLWTAGGAGTFQKIIAQKYANMRLSIKNFINTATGVPVSVNTKASHTTEAIGKATWQRTWNSYQSRNLPTLRTLPPTGSTTGTETKGTVTGTGLSAQLPAAYTGLNPTNSTTYEGSFTTTQGITVSWEMVSGQLPGDEAATGEPPERKIGVADANTSRTIGTNTALLGPNNWVRL